MPLVRIDLVESEDDGRQIGQVAYHALVSTLRVPKHDRFPVITEHRRSIDDIDTASSSFILS